jgi:hypothetical protein
LWAPYAAQQREPGASAYLGYVVLIISIVGLIGWRKRREVWWWLMLGAGFAVLSAGPQLQWAGRLLDVRLPYWYLDQYLPGFDITGIPGRFVVVLSLAMAVLAAYGLSFLVARCNTARAAWIASVISLLVVVEFLAVPLDGSRTDVPAFYERMAGDREPYTVLDVKWDANYLMHAQTVHGKALIGGWLARLPVDQARYLEQGSLDRVISYLLLGEEATHIADAAALRRALNEGLARHQTRYIIDHDHAVATWIEHVLGWRAVCTEQAGDHIAVYAAAP